MNNGYMSLGMFVFQLHSAPLDTLNRDSRWRWAEGNELGQLPGQQYLGRDSDTFTLKGSLAPEITGGAEQLDQLRTLADTGEPQQLIDGNGKVLGDYILTGIRSDHNALMKDGTARTITFELTLKRVERRYVETLGTARH